MKVFKNNKCYVEAEDLLRFPVPNFIYIPNELRLDDFVMFDGTNEIEYFKNRQDIMDYNLMSELSQKDLDEMIEKTKAEFLRLSSQWLESSGKGRKKLNQDEEYQNSLKICKAIYECLSKYNSNKENIDFTMKYIELKYECQRYPRIQLSSDGYILPNTFDPEYIVDHCAEDGFIENYCLSEEEREQVEKVRELKKLREATRFNKNSF